MENIFNFLSKIVKFYLLYELLLLSIFVLIFVSKKSKRKKTNLKYLISGILSSVIILGSTIGGFAWINNITRASMVITMKEDSGSNIQISTSKTGSYSNSVSGSNSFNIAPCVSTDGLTFYDKNNNSSSEYAQLLFYVKGDNTYDSLYVDSVTVTPNTPGLKMAVEYDGVSNVLNLDSFSRTKLNKTVDTTPKAVKIRVWLDGNTITEQITGDINIAVDFSAE